MASDKPLPVDPDFNNSSEQDLGIPSLVSTGVPTPTPATSSGNDLGASADLNTLIAVESMLKNVISRMDLIKNELKTDADMLKSAFESDPVYREFDQNAKAAAKDKLAAKKEILRKPDVAELNLKVQSKRSELKELKEKMSDYLTQYQQLSGANEIEGEDGEVRVIVYTAKLVRRNDKFDGFGK